MIAAKYFSYSTEAKLSHRFTPSVMIKHEFPFPKYTVSRTLALYLVISTLPFSGNVTPTISDTCPPQT